MRRAAMAVGVGALAGLTFAFASGAMSLLVTRVFRLWERWITWQGATPDQREQMRREDDRFDWVPTDMGRGK